jgi:3-oxoadipate enol-lactonase
MEADADMFATTTDGTRLHFESAGNGAPVVLIHGLSSDHTEWRYVAPALAERYRVISVDVRGHGSSAKPHVPLEVATLADDVVALLDWLQIDKAVLVGLSMGGGISQTTAIRHPERVRALALLSTSSSFPESTRERFRYRAEVAEREGMAPLIDSMVERWFTPEFMAAHPDEVARTREVVLANDPLAFAAACRANAARDWTGDLGRITCPVLVLAGEQDPGSATGSAKTFGERLPDVEVHVVEGASHAVPIERPEVANRLLLAFLDRLP